MLSVVRTSRLNCSCRQLRSFATRTVLQTYKRRVWDNSDRVCGGCLYRSVVGGECADRSRARDLAIVSSISDGQERKGLKLTCWHSSSSPPLAPASAGACTWQGLRIRISSSSICSITATDVLKLVWLSCQVSVMVKKEKG
jgi:hypothetical protein